MKWFVAYRASAEQDLAEIWNNAPDRAAVSAASNEIDRLLAKDPLHAGEGRDENRRILFVTPLAVSFEVNVDDRQVTVHGVWRWPIK